MFLHERKLTHWIDGRITIHSHHGRQREIQELENLKNKLPQMSLFTSEGIIAQGEGMHELREMFEKLREVHLSPKQTKVINEACEQIAAMRESQSTESFDATDRIRALGECIRALTEAMDVANGGEACHQGVKASLCFSINMISGMIMKLAGRGADTPDRLEKLLNEFILQMKSYGEVAARCSVYPNGELPTPGESGTCRPDTEIDPEPHGKATNH